jgi:hypothetical protein
VNAESTLAPPLSVIGVIRFSKKILSKKRRAGGYCASRRSAVGYTNSTIKKALTWAGLLMEVARDTDGAPPDSRFADDPARASILGDPVRPQQRLSKV